jgi:hypothetical protein
MENQDFIDVYHPGSMHEVLTIKSLLEGKNIRYYINNENLCLTIPLCAIGSEEVRLMVETPRAQEVRDLLVAMRVIKS